MRLRLSKDDVMYFQKQTRSKGKYQPSASPLSNVVLLYWVPPALSLSSGFLNRICMSFNKFGDFSVISSIFFLCWCLSSPGASVTWMLGLLIKSQRSQWSVLFFFQLFFSVFFRLDNFYWSTSKFTDSFLCLLLCPSSEFLISDTIFLSLKCPLDSLFIVYVSLQRLFLCSFIPDHLMHSAVFTLTLREDSYSRTLKVLDNSNIWIILRLAFLSIVFILEICSHFTHSLYDKQFWITDWAF